MEKQARSPLAWVPTLYFAQGLPFFSVALIASLMLKSMGVPNDDIAHWTAYIGTAWIFKPLWSPFLELASSKKIIVVSLQLAGGVCLGLVALALQLPFWLAACVTMLALVAICSATPDIACDGLYIASLTEKQQAEYAGWTGTFFNAGRFISLGGLLILAGHLEKSQGVVPAWSIIFCILAATMIALGLYHSWSLPLAKNVVAPDTTAAGIARTLKDVIIDFFKKPGIWVAILFIIYFLFTFQPTSLTTIGAALSMEMFGYGFGFVGVILYTWPTSA